MDVSSWKRKKGSLLRPFFPGRTNSISISTDRPSELLVGGGMPDADCRCTPRRPWSLGRGGQTPSPIKFIIRTKSSGKTLTRILADLDPNPPPLAPLALPLCSPDLRSYLRGGILGGRQRGRGRKEPGPGGRGKEGRSEGSELCDTFDPLDWKMAAASLWPPPLRPLWPRYVCK